MTHADLLFSWLILTAIMLSLWTGALITAACFFFAPVLRAHIPETYTPTK
jgi:hypothetical protein